MSAAAHPITSTSEPAAPAEDIKAVASEASKAPKEAGKPAKQQQQQKGGAGEQGEKKAKKDKKGGGASSGPLELSPPPEFFADRIKIFDEYKAKYDKWVAGQLTLSARRLQLIIRTT